jgi:hypothetical protein
MTERARLVSFWVCDAAQVGKFNVIEQRELKSDQPNKAAFVENLLSREKKRCSV